MKITQILKKPIITEKTYKMMDINQFVFEIDKDATKPMVKKAFEIIFEKKVESVNLLKKKSKKRRIGRFLGKTRNIKKAIIKLKKGEVFTFFDEDKMKKITKDIKEKKLNSKEIENKGIKSKFKDYWKTFTTLDTKKTNKKDKK